MTKEEYLRMYKEDKLAELCEMFEKDMNCYHDKLMSCQNDAYIARKKQLSFHHIGKMRTSCLKN